MASAVKGVCACAREEMLCCVVPSDMSGCNAGAYATGTAGPSAVADVPVHDTCELRAEERLLISVTGFVRL